MTPWRWFAGDVDDHVYSLACDCLSRDEAIRQAVRRLRTGELFQIIEARSTEDVRAIGREDYVPFLRTRNHEVLTAGPHLFQTEEA